MTNTRFDRGPHIDDADLVRLLDNECAPGEAQQMRAHIEICAECKNNAETLRQASELFSRSLSALDAQVVPAQSTPARAPTVGRKFTRRETQFPFLSRRVLRAAAVLAAVALVFTATPARAWLVQGWETLKSLVMAVPSEPPAETDGAETVDAAASSLIRFNPRGPEFRLEFTDRPAGGMLMLIFDSTATASAGVVGGEGDEEMILLPDGLRIRNSISSTVDYEVRLPLTVSLLEVRVAGSLELRLDVQAGSGPFMRELALSGENR